MRVPLLLTSALIGVSYTCNAQTPADDVSAIKDPDRGVWLRSPTVPVGGDWLIASVTLAANLSCHVDSRRADSLARMDLGGGQPSTRAGKSTGWGRHQSV
jgi:hypothetical protein